MDIGMGGGMGVMPSAFAERMAFGWRKKRSLSSLFKSLATPDHEQKSESKEISPEKRTASAAEKVVTSA